MDEYIRIPDAIRRYQVSRHQIYRMHRRGLLPLYKAVGDRATSVQREELERALAVPRPTGRPSTRIDREVAHDDTESG